MFKSGIYRICCLSSASSLLLCPTILTSFGCGDGCEPDQIEARPTVNISPLSQDARSFTVSVSLTDDERNPKQMRVYFTLDGKVAGELVPESMSFSHTFEAPCGTHKVYARVVDEEGLEGSQEKEIVPSLPALSVVVDSPAVPDETSYAYFHSGDEILFGGRVTGGEGWDIQVRLETDLDGTLYEEPLAADGTFSMTGGLSDGLHALTAIAVVDCSGTGREVESDPLAILVQSDMDGDDYFLLDPEMPDCDDTDAAVYPGADEFCDGLDNDCDSETDEGYDRDGDSYPTCALGDRSADCYDEDAAVYPDAVETCNRVDDDCDGSVDEGFDSDGDGYASCGDCDDHNPQVYPGARESCDGVDNDCDTLVDEESDLDGDGWTTCRGDCNDADPAIKPDAAELCDAAAVDEDCDGTANEGFDEDGDGYSSCAFSGRPADCDDSLAVVYPGAVESCDGRDNDCDRETDEEDAVNVKTFCRDGDGDGYGSAAATIKSCQAPEGYVAECTDCNDTDKGVNPGASEVCDTAAADENCDGTGNEGFDRDGDGYSQCAFGGKAADCNDQLDVVYPGALEVCDNLDNDCDKQTDEYASDAKTFCRDTDADGFGDPALTTRACKPPAGYIEECTDCNDEVATVNPGVTEECNNGEDDNCDGKADECRMTGDRSIKTDSVQCFGEAGDHAGVSVASAGDIDGDGKDDILIGAPHCDDREAGTDVGCVFIVFSDLRKNFPASIALVGQVRLVGLSPGDETGISVSSAGDVNGDGLADVLVGAAGRDSADGLQDVGAVYVVLGRDRDEWPATLSLDGAEAEIIGDTAGERLGASVAAAGDVTGDGLSDVIIGAPSYDSPVVGSKAGAAYVFAGPLSGTLRAQAAYTTFIGEKGDNYAGQSVAGAGDVSCDGYPDLVIGAPRNDNGASNMGAAYLIDRLTRGTVYLTSYRAKLVGEKASDLLGSTVAASDVNGDMCFDLIVGAPGEDTGGVSAGAAYLVYGPVMGTVGMYEAVTGFKAAKFFGEATGDNAGSAVSALGDVDADGYGDLLTGAQNAGDQTGIAYLVYGTAAQITGSRELGSTRDISFTGAVVGNQVGYSGAVTGDFDGDGKTDVLIGAPKESNYGGTEAGAVYLIWGQGI